VSSSYLVHLIIRTRHELDTAKIAGSSEKDHNETTICPPFVPRLSPCRKGEGDPVGGLITGRCVFLINFMALKTNSTGILYVPVLNNEKVVLLQVAQGDEQAFRVLFGAYHQLLAAHVYRLTESMELAEEIVQDVFLKIWMSREALAEVHHFHAYLFVVSKHQALNALRKIARERSRQRTWANDTAVAEAAHVDDRTSFYNLIDEAIRQLPPQQQKVYLLSRHDHLKYREIAEQMGISPETVKKYMQLAIASISAYVRDNIDVFLLLAALTSLN